MKCKPKNAKPIRSKKMQHINDNTCIERCQDIRQIYDRAQMYASRGRMPLEVTEDQIHRIMVNEIRHTYSNYGNNLRYVHMMDKKNDSQYYLYKNIILDRIATAYPFLADECRDQKYKINMVRIRK